jgi:hypothetical protein
LLDAPWFDVFVLDVHSLLAEERRQNVLGFWYSVLVGSPKPVQRHLQLLEVEVEVGFSASIAGAAPQQA